MSETQSELEILNYIDGEFVATQDRSWLDNHCPATGEKYAKIARSKTDDVQRAVAAAERAFVGWSQTAPQERAQWLYRIADAIDKNLQTLAEAESRDQGKPVWLARQMDVPRAALNFRFFASEITQVVSESSLIHQTAVNYVIRRPVGVAGLISPWNLPLYLLTWKMAPALAAGNTVVCKPSELTPMTAFLLSKILVDIQFPKGVVNVVHGLGAEAGEALVQHPRVPLISFTGGTATGKNLARGAATHIKKLSLELGGKNANIVFSDAHLEKAVEGSLRSSFLNQGEICLCGSRLLVQRAGSEKFIESFVAKTKKLRVGDPRDEKNFLGPLASHEHLQKVRSFIQLAKTDKLSFLAGDEALDLSPELASGYYLRPTIIDNVPPTSRLFQEEIFGPVVTITYFDTVAEAIDLTNQSSYGLSASLWTQNLGMAHTVAQSLHVGTVWVNTWMLRDLRMPFGGQKQSGIGSEGGRHSYEFFTEPTTICVSLT